MNYKTTLMIAGIAAAAFMAIGSVTPVFESAFAQNATNGGISTTIPTTNNFNQVGNCNHSDPTGGQNCRNNQGGQAGGSSNSQYNLIVKQEASVNPGIDATNDQQYSIIQSSDITIEK